MHWGISLCGPCFHLFTTKVRYPLPLVSWNHRVRRKFSLRSLNLKDLRVESLITNDLASISHLVVKPACPIDTLGHENGRFRSDHSVVIKDRPRLRGLLRGIFEAKNAEMVLGRTRLSRRARASLPNQETIVTFGEWDVCDVRTEFW